MTQKDRLDIINTSAFYLIATIWLLLNTMGIISVTICPLKLLFHIPCPGCGITRASGLLLKGQFFDAFILNPNSAPLYCNLSISSIHQDKISS